MNTPLAAADENYAWLGMVPVGMFVVALIINVSSLQTKDMNRKSCHATSMLFIALIGESAAWTVRSFGGGTETGVFWTVVASATLHVLSATVALRAFWEYRTMGKWPHGRRRATWGFWLNVIALAVIAGWFFVCAHPNYYKRIFE